MSTESKILAEIERRLTAEIAEIQFSSDEERRTEAHLRRILIEREVRHEFVTPPGVHPLPVQPLTPEMRTQIRRQLVEGMRADAPHLDPSTHRLSWTAKAYDGLVIRVDVGMPSDVAHYIRELYGVDYGGTLVDLDDALQELHEAFDRLRNA